MPNKFSSVTRENGQTRIHEFRVILIIIIIIIIIFFFLFKPAISLLEQVKVIIFPPSVSRVARGVHGHQAIVFLQLHISTVDREVHHSTHKTTPFLFEAVRPGGSVRAHTHCAYANFDRVCSCSLWCSCARARKRACAWTGIYTCSECACVDMCTTITYFLRGFATNGKNECNKCKNHFNEMKGM